MAVSAPVDFSTIMSTLYTWFADQIGLPVTFGQQDAPQPPLNPGYGVITITSGPTVTTLGDETRRRYDPAQPLGTEVLHDIVGIRTMVVGFQVRTAINDPINQATNALALMAGAQAALAAPSVRDTFTAVNLGIVRQGNIVDLSAALADTWSQIAQMDVTFNVLSSTTDSGVSFIEKIELSSTSFGIVDLELP